jgi:CubicO group peptidase (beta-lactamase class C family)
MIARPLALLLAAAPSFAFAQAPPPAPGADAPPEARVDAIFAEWDRPDSPGAAVAIVREGRVLFARGYGMANLEHGVPITRETVFDIASISKQFAGMAIAMLAREGRVDLDVEVRAYLPDVPDFGAPITVRHLLHHTSGLRDWPEAMLASGVRYEDVISFADIGRMVRRQRELDFAPGAEFLYSNTGYNLLAEIVETVTGEAFPAWTARNLFEPLGMRNTHFPDDHRGLVRNRAASYAPGPGGELRNVPNALTALGSSSLHSTVDDLALWVANLADGTVGGAEALAMMRQRGVLSDGSPTDYGFGLTLGRYRGVPFERHGGAWAGFRTMLIHFPEQRLGVIVLGNLATFRAQDRALDVAELFLGGAMTARRPAPPTAQPEETRAAADLAADALAQYAGLYRSDELESAFAVRVEDGGLLLSHHRNGTTRLSPRGPDAFSDGRFRVDFVRGEDGEVHGLRLSGGRVRNLYFARQAQ